MKKQLLFIPDIFFVMLIIFSCERSDLTELRQSGNYFYSDNPLALNNLDIEEMLIDTVSWTEVIEGYKGKAVSLAHQLKGFFTERV
ncbi:hypothetical protein ADIS_2009 [Lunatimonas lonarensis]|uniref:Uncharacterized protein n=1 Tax=Lunatimonas lonarensis TaxID=1232681 RepID=R7ZU00_9BACT|nr:hypothetical protein [Lunatimonas lonarensis]EON77479.1 hypothetical protein ADIS_2009 [Lunatimonas lonarensis]